MDQPLLISQRQFHTLAGSAVALAAASCLPSSHGRSQPHFPICRLSLRESRILLRSERRRLPIGRSLRASGRASTRAGIAKGGTDC